MLGTYYYHEIIRKTIIAFGTLFNTIDHPASATYCKATKNTANTEIPKKK